MAADEDYDEDEAQAGTPRSSEQRRAFEEMKQKVQDIDARYAEGGELKVLGGAVAKAGEALRNGQTESLGKAIDDCKRLVDGMRQSVDAEAEDKPRRASSLQSWRPNWHFAPRGEPMPSPSQSSPSDAAAPRDEGASALEGHRGEPEAAEAEPAGSLLFRKKDADEAVNSGLYKEALDIYQAILHELDQQRGAAEGADEQALRIALLSNAALCSLKLSPDQRHWARVRELLQDAIWYCDAALRLDGSLSKAHFRRGCALEALERFPEAFHAYDKASRFAPSDPRILEALDRMTRYEEAQLGPEVMAKAKEHLEAIGALPRSRKRQARVGAAKTPKLPCARCRGDASVGNFFLAPCGHGPFCRDCRARVVREGHGLDCCPVCGGIVDEWRQGAGKPITAEDLLKDMRGKLSEAGLQDPMVPSDSARGSPETQKRWPSQRPKRESQREANHGQRCGADGGEDKLSLHVLD